MNWLTGVFKFFGLTQILWIAAALVAMLTSSYVAGCTNGAAKEERKWIVKDAKRVEAINTANQKIAAQQAMDLQKKEDDKREAIGDYEIQVEAVAGERDQVLKKLADERAARRRAESERDKLRDDRDDSDKRASSEAGASLCRGDDPKGTELHPEDERFLVEFAEEANRVVAQLQLAQKELKICTGG